MTEILEILQREFVYVSYYFMVQLRQIFGYWVLGMVVGSLVSVFAKDAIHNAFDRIRDKKWGLWGVVPASLLGIASPLCMYGTFKGFEPKASHDTHPNRFLRNVIFIIF